MCCMVLAEMFILCACVLMCSNEANVFDQILFLSKQDVRQLPGMVT